MAQVKAWDMVPGCLVYPECPYAGRFIPGFGDKQAGDCECSHPRAETDYCGPNNLHGDCAFDLKTELSGVICP